MNRMNRVIRMVPGMSLLFVVVAVFGVFCSPVRTHGQEQPPKYGQKPVVKRSRGVPGLVRLIADGSSGTEYGTGWIVKITPDAAYIVTPHRMVYYGNLRVSFPNPVPDKRTSLATAVTNPSQLTRLESTLGLLKVDAHELPPTAVVMPAPPETLQPDIGARFVSLGTPRNAEWSSLIGTLTSIMPDGPYSVSFLPNQDIENAVPGSWVRFSRSSTSPAGMGMLMSTSKGRNTGFVVPVTTISCFLLAHGIKWGTAAGEEGRGSSTGPGEPGNGRNVRGRIPPGDKPPAGQNELVKPDAAIVPDKAIVRITNKTSMKQGTGFIVRLDENETWILTASHVIQGDDSPQIEFYGRKGDPVVGTTISKEEDELTGLAIVKVKQSLSPDLVALPLSSLKLNVEDEVKVLGFPRSGTSLQHAIERVRSREGRNMKIGGDPLSEGFSGSPVIKDGKVVGMVMSIEEGSNVMPAAQLRLFWEGEMPDKPLPH